MKASIVTTCLNSHEVVRRQCIHLQSVMPDDVEWVLIDDGSTPPLVIDGPRFVLYHTNNFAAWTEREARAIGVGIARSDKLICVDIDHIVTRELLEFICDSPYDFTPFRRALAVLDENGELRADSESLAEYGVPWERLAKGTKTTPPGNCYAISRRLFELLRQTAKGRRLKHCVNRIVRSGQAITCPTEQRPLVYAIPNGRYCGDADANPFGLFHSLSRKSREYASAEKILI